MERGSVSSFISLETDNVEGSFRGLGRFRIFFTVDAAMKMFKRASWFAIQNLPQSTLAFVISQIRAAISKGVLLAGVVGDFVRSSILWSQR